MPELPEIETIKRGIINLEKQQINEVIVRNPNLRYKIDKNIHKLLAKQRVNKIHRRAKYLILTLDKGFLILHLGMSGSLTLVDNSSNLKKHDHVDIIFSNGQILRYNDPRRFGAIVFAKSIDDHTLLNKLGPEPLDPSFDASYLLKCLHKKASSIKQLIMDNHIVVGVGNIYACEALFLSHILPMRSGTSITKNEASLLVKSIKHVLLNAIELGGSTLRDYKKSDGTLGYFQNMHNVYGRTNQQCKICNKLIATKRLGQRNSFYCPTCQK